MQEGADADIVVFDPATIADRATFQKPMEPSVGVRYLVVGGTVLVDQGKIVEGVFPGKAALGPRKVPDPGRARSTPQYSMLQSGERLLILS
jgi:N-acyl-D-aspartate/D-glutamate deacylase